MMDMRSNNGPTESNVMPRKRILVVDDESGSLESIHETLTLHGYESIPCQKISAALTMLDSRAALDLAVFDFCMPEMNGLELHARIRQLRPELPCIMVTGYSTIENYLKAINSGVFEYLNKPYRNRELLKVVAAAIKGSPMTGGVAGRSHTDAFRI